jgi:glycosyltransferase involved in cell wall biosynthesis/GT2 family glycosyltransferase
VTPSKPSLVSVIVLVKNGARYLNEVLITVGRQRLDAEIETLVIDSGSIDGSVEIAWAAGARVIEISPSAFQHGATRNFAAEEARGEYLVFLTQDATPASEDWLDKLIAPIDVEKRIGLSFGPHLPRIDTSPMVARELEEFFASFAHGRGLRIDCSADAADPPSGFFSNVNSCIARACFDEVRFRKVDYAEDQAFARDALAAGWCKAFVPDAAVLHAHDYPFGQFMRRYFDEYRGLRETIGHVEPIGAQRLVRTARSQVRGDLAYMRNFDWGRRRRFGWGLRSARHHTGRGVFAALGSRADRLPKQLARRLSLEQRSETTADANGGMPVMRTVPAAPNYQFEYILDRSRAVEVPLAPASPPKSERLHIAWLVPGFRRGSGGHMALFRIAHELEARGHSCSIWVHDATRTMHGRSAVAHREIVDNFAPLKAGVFSDFRDWQGADVAFATGWQTAYPIGALPDCRLKAYLVQDYEPDFYPASANRIWAEATYRMGYPCLASSPWLRDLLRERYGAQAEVFEYGVDFEQYHRFDAERDEETVLFYARPTTPRRATELGVLALAELLRRRPGVRVVVFGDVKPPPAPFEYEFGGVLDPESLAELYNRASLGLVISLTNYSLVPKEMMACGLPVVDVRGSSAESVFASDRKVIELADPDPEALAARIEALLDDPLRRDSVAGAAQRFVSGMTWSATAEVIEARLADWLGERWDQALAAEGAA